MLRSILEWVRPRTGWEVYQSSAPSAEAVHWLRTGTLWRDLPARFDLWWRPWKWLRRWARLGIWDALLAEAVRVGRPEWAEVFPDGMVVRAHQKASG
jgi:hypothetical protein